VFTRRLTRGVEGHVSYAWGHAIDTDSGESVVPHLPLSAASVATERGSSDYDRRHVMRATLSCVPPSPRGPAWLAMLGADWRLDLIGTVQSGAPITVTATRDLGFGSYLVRPDLVPGVPVWVADAASPGGRRLNPDAFVLPTDARQGTLGRNALLAPALRQVDLTLTRSLRVGASLKAQLRLESFNVFNVPNFGAPFAQLGTAGFGRPYESWADALGTGTLSQGGLAPVQQAGAPRSVQIGVRLAW
jgi:hypothetical protein